MKRAGQRSRLAAIEAALGSGGVRIVIEGGVPAPAANSAPAEPVQLDLPLPKPPPGPSRASGRAFTWAPRRPRKSILGLLRPFRNPKLPAGRRPGGKTSAGAAIVVNAPRTDPERSPPPLRSKSWEAEGKIATPNHPLWEAH